MSTEALRLALDALEDARHHMSASGAFTENQLAAQDAIRAALAAPAASEPVARYPHPDEDDPVALWAEIHRLRAAVQGPDGYATWQEAATAERVRRVRAERAAPAAPSVPPGWRLEVDPALKWATIINAASQLGQDFYPDRDPLVFAFLRDFAAAPTGAAHG